MTFEDDSLSLLSRECRQVCRLSYRSLLWDVQCSKNFYGQELSVLLKMIVKNDLK